MTDFPEDEELEHLREKRRRELENEISSAGKCMVDIIKEENFDGFLNSNNRTVIDFWAEWCGPCRMVGPVIEKLAHEFEDQVAFGKCNTDECPGITAKFQISAIPTIMFFENGTLVNKLIGAYPEPSLRQAVKEVFRI